MSEPMSPLSVPLDLELESWQRYQAAQRRRLSGDPHRPGYHLSAPSGWLNDPNGLIHRRGSYHLFYQHNPHGAKWGPPYWGHVVSDDLVHWRDLPPAISPQLAPVDAGGCWSGCMVDDDGVPTLVYTGVNENHLGEQMTCLAFGDDSLTRWEKYPGNPVVRAPEGLAITQNAYRDPFVWREDGNWYQVIGTSLADRGQALLYRSDDLRNWRYLDLLIPEDIRAALDDEGHTWECPNLFPLGDKHVLLVSLSGDGLMYPVAFVGTFKDRQFHPETMQRYDWGYRCFYAPLTMSDSGGRQLVWGWLQAQRSPKAQLRAGWSGIMSLPRELSLDGTTLISRFAPELETLRRDGRVERNLDLAQSRELRVFERPACELKLCLERGQAQTSTLRLRHSEREFSLLVIDWEGSELRLDKENSSLSPYADKAVHRAPFPESWRTLNLHLYVDHSTLELIVNGSLCLSARVYPETSGALSLRLESGGGIALVEKVESWALSL